MTEPLQRVKALGADYIWLCPFFESPWVDGGYDVADYLTVDSRFGTLEDFKEFVCRAHELGLGVLLDLVLNHTSTEHEWFKRSVAGDGWYKDFYCWIDEDLGWGNFFDGGSAFEYCPERGQYYLHLFNKKQADLNWDNPRVLEEFQKIIDYWARLGADGFRLDSVLFLSKDLKRTHLPRKSLGAFAGMSHYYMRKKTLDVLRDLFAKRVLFTVGEVGMPFRFLARKLAGRKGPLTAMLNIMVQESIDKRAMFLEAPTSIKRLRRNLRKWSRLPFYVAAIESHDAPRMTSRTGRDGVELIEMLFDCNPQYACIYQGQELGLKNPILSDDIADYSDAMFIMKYNKLLQQGMSSADAVALLKPGARENARAPLDLDEYARQEADPGSCLNATKTAIQAWKARK